MKFSCPDCGTDMDFDEEIGKLTCPSCKHSEQMEGYQNGFVRYITIEDFKKFGDEEARLHVCKNCGMKLITDNRSPVPKCSFCGGDMALGDSISGDLKPTKIIPFSITEKQAMKSFRKWNMKLKFSPKEFRKKRKDIKCQAVYLPAWLFQMRGQGQIQIHATKSRHLKEENEKIIETDHYDVYRKFDLGFDNIPIGASEKIDKRFLEAMEPYDFSAARTFHSYEDFGYLAEPYHVTADAVKKIAEKRIRESMDEYLLKTVSGYEEYNIVDREYEIGEASIEYVWLPVMFISLDTGDSDYLFVLNGQTGKLAFDPPFSLVKILVTGGLGVSFLFLLFRIITVFLGGALL